MHIPFVPAQFALQRQSGRAPSLQEIAATKRPMGRPTIHSQSVRVVPPSVILYQLQGGGKFSMGKFLPGKIPPQSLKVMGKIAPPFSMVKGKA